MKRHQLSALWIALGALLLPQFSQAANERGARLLMVTQSAGFRHGSVNRKNQPLAPAERAITQLGIASNLFRATCTQDCASDFTRKNLDNFDLVLFYTTGKLPIKKEDMDYFLNVWLKKKGHGFIGTHSAADTYKDCPTQWFDYAVHIALYILIF